MLLPSKEQRCEKGCARLKPPPEPRWLHPTPTLANGTNLVATQFSQIQSSLVGLFNARMV